jgi:hypothetical protein
LRPTLLLWYRLRWPREVEPDQLLSVMRLLATVGGTPVIIESVGTHGSVTHHLAIPAGRAGGMVSQLRAALPGLAVELLPDRSVRGLNRAVELRLSTRRRALRSDDLPSVSRAVLTALSHVGRGEVLVLQWILGRALTARPVPNQLEGWSHESWTLQLASAFVGGARPADSELRSALRAKQAEPGWRLVGRLAVRAETDGRQRQLIRQVLGALRSAEAPGVGFWVRFTPRVRVERATVPRWRFPLLLNVSELAALLPWPAGPTGDLPVAMVPARLLRPARAIPRRGRVIGEATFPGSERPLALSASDSLRHVWALGPTGSGKSTLLLNLIAQDIEAGRGVVVIEPKSDLIAAVLERIPASRIGDVVLLDPTDDQRPVGLNPLASAGRSPELVADQLLGLFHSLYAAHWGPRTQDILGAALLTLARTRDMTLAALPLLLTDPGFRRRIVGGVDDPIGLGNFWASFEAWSEAERTAAIAPVMNKLRPFLLRPELRAVIGQPEPRFDVRQVFTERKLLLVNLAKGQVGPETAALLGSLVITQLWQATLGRSAIAPERRHPVFVYVDEFQDYLHLPLDFADALAQARGLGVGFVLAHQYLHQLEAGMRSAVLANAQSRVSFRLGIEDARLLAAGSTLAPEDFQGLGAFQCYTQLVANAAVQPWCSARTLPPVAATSDPIAVRAASRERYGIDRTDIDARIRELVFRRGGGEDDLGPRPRRNGGRA